MVLAIRARLGDLVADLEQILNRCAFCVPVDFHQTPILSQSLVLSFVWIAILVYTRMKLVK